MRRRFLGWVLGCLLAPAFSSAQEHEHMDLWADQATGQLVLSWQFERVLPLYETFCAPGAGQCLFTTINPAFLAESAEPPSPTLVPLAAGTPVEVELTDIAPGFTLNVNGQALRQRGEKAPLGVVPFHVHPSWQLVAPRDASGEFFVSYRVLAPGGPYESSEVYTNRFLIAHPAATPTPVATPTRGPLRCAGDCDSSGTVTVDEVVNLVRLALGLASVDSCPAGDRNGDGIVTVDEIVAAVNALLNGCADEATLTFAELQRELFRPRCTSVGCHSARDRVAGLDLESEQAWSHLVDVPPENFAASLRGLVRVRAGDLAGSFLWIKLQVQVSPEYGSRMPLGGESLSEEERSRVARWILDGALP